MEMEHRRIGKTGMSASIIGLGAEHLDGKPYSVAEDTIHAALDNGVNIMDVFMPGEEVRKNIGRAIAGRRDKVLIQGHIGSTDIGQQYDISRDLPTCKRYFENLLRDLGTDYIDFGMLFFIDSDKDFDAVFSGGILDYAKTLKKEGVIRAIGASAHNPVTARRVVESGEIDLLLFSINPAFDLMPNVFDPEEMLSYKTSMAARDSDRDALYTLCERQGVGITTMKTTGAGKLLSAAHTPFAKPLTVAQCIHYALTRPGVVSTLIGCQSRAQVLEAVGYLTCSDEEKEYASVISGTMADFTGSCVYCGHCLPCPSEIDIAATNKYLDIALLDKANIPPSIAQHYHAMAHHGSECIACGSCETRCPFQVEIIERMRAAAGLFGE